MLSVLMGLSGKTDKVTHHIHTTTDKPVNQKSRPINPSLEKSLREQVDKWLKFDIIEPAVSPWNSALVPVEKKSGEIRWCVDYRGLNNITEKDVHPIGDITTNSTSVGRFQDLLVPGRQWSFPCGSHST